MGREPEELVLEAAFAELDLEAKDLANLGRRYLDYMDWLERAAARNRVAYYLLRITAIVLAAVVPAVVAADLGSGGRVAGAVLGVVVAASTAAEAFLHLGDRWRHYRAIVELMKTESWLFVQGAGGYAGHSTRESLPAFVEQMERLIAAEVQTYVSAVVAERASGQRPPPA